MPSIFHKDIRPIPAASTEGNHVIHHFTFDDVADMNAGVDANYGAVAFVANDAGKVARVGASAPYTYYILANHTGPAWTPLGGGGNAGYSGPLVFDHTGTSELHIGSVFLQMGQTISLDSSCMIGTQAGGTASFRIRDFTGGSVVLTMSATGVGLSVATLGADVPITVDDYYDFYLFGDAALTQSLIRGLRLLVT